uniref:Beta-glucosidase n=1 Tax=Solanum tuberosum TaxID=4113 RepID=M0ZL31_SOLTU
MWEGVSINESLVCSYAETYFKNFGDSMKNWITFNEPRIDVIQDFDIGLQTPGRRCSILLQALCSVENFATEPYIVTHNLLLAHTNFVVDIRGVHDRVGSGFSNIKPNHLCKKF